LIRLSLEFVVFFSVFNAVKIKIWENISIYIVVRNVLGSKQSYRNQEIVIDNYN